MTRGNMAAVLLLSAALLTGCAARGPVSVSEMYGFCLTSEGGRMCTWHKEFCQGLRRAAEQEHASRDDCVASCRQVRDAYWNTLADFGCAQHYRHGLEWCERYCTTNYR